jgi:hypothetical protein
MNFSGKYFSYYGKQISIGIIGGDVHFDSDIKGEYYIGLRISILFQTIIFKLPAKASWFANYRKPHFDGFYWGVCLNFDHDQALYITRHWKGRYTTHYLMHYKLVKAAEKVEHVFDYTFFHPKHGRDVTLNVSIYKAYYHNTFWKKLKRQRYYVNIQSDTYRSSTRIPKEFKRSREIYAQDFVYKYVGELYEGITQADISTKIRSNKINSIF